jgi:hypothetical protein
MMRSASLWCELIILAIYHGFMAVDTAERANILHMSVVPFGLRAILSENIISILISSYLFFQN